MSSSGRAGVCVMAALLWAGANPLAKADAKSNPYESIVARNVFALKPPPPPPDPTPPPPPPAPLAKVILTGITSIFGPSSKRAILEITEVEAGKPGTVKKPILREGERDGSIEVVSIDVEKSLVLIRNGGVETNLTFEVQKSPAGPATVAPLPGAPGGPMTAGFNPPHHLQPGAVPGGLPGAAPTVASPSYLAGSSGSGGVTILSGGTPAGSSPIASPSGSISVSTPNNPAASGGYGYGINIPATGGATPENPARPIPSRPIRTEAAPTAPYQAPVQRAPINLPGGFPPLPPINESPFRRQSQ